MSKKSDLIFAMNNLTKRLKRAMDDIEGMKAILKKKDPSPRDLVIARLDDPTSGRGQYQVSEPENGLVKAVKRLVEGKRRVTSSEALEGIPWPDGFDRSPHARKIAICRAMKAIGWMRSRTSEKDAQGKRPEFFTPMRVDWGPHEPAEQPVAAPWPAHVTPFYGTRMWYETENTPEAVSARERVAGLAAVVPAVPAVPVVPEPLPTPECVPAIVAPVEVAPVEAPAEAPLHTVINSAIDDLWAEMSENIDPNLRW